jgi:hypothetical protein
VKDPEYLMFLEKELLDGLRGVFLQKGECYRSGLYFQVAYV